MKPNSGAQCRHYFFSEVAGAKSCRCVATVTAGMNCMAKYANDIGVRDDMIKVEVEDLALKHGWEVAEDSNPLIANC